MFLGQPFGGLVPGARGAVLAALMRTGTPMTGRQVHGVLDNQHSLRSVQEGLKSMVALGLVDTVSVGSATVHTVNEDHYAIAPLRVLIDPMAALRAVVTSAADSNVQAVLLFGSAARGAARVDSDVDLAVIAALEWDGRVTMQEAVRTHMGNDCDVMVFTEDEFRRRAAAAEPVVLDILQDGVALLGSMPHVRKAMFAGRVDG
jgi:predicted nucleotidyltransferase